MLAKKKLNTTKVVLSKDLIDSCISHDDFVSVNVLKEYNDMKEPIKNPRTINIVVIIKEILISEKEFTDTYYERSII